ncbi:MAG: hypothetical protein GY714_10535 [Desulfobacterales bacterium]|nr:hypothetical protein [Desulfobacterales bacterium]
MLTSLFSGGLVGVLGSLLTNLFDCFKQKQKDNQSIALRKIDLEMMDKEYSCRIHKSEIEANTSMEVSADNTFLQSYKHDTKSYSKGLILSWFGKALFVLVDVVRGLIRPLLTLYLIFLVSKIQTDVHALIVKAGVDVVVTAEALEIYMNIVKMILFLSSMSISWWFGTRGKKQK